MLTWRRTLSEENDVSPLEPCNCSPKCDGRLVYADDDIVGKPITYDAEFDARILAFLALPKCRRCKMPTPDEFVDPYWWEAGERVCDDCGKPERPGGRHPVRKPKTPPSGDRNVPVRDRYGRFIVGAK